MHRRPGLAGRNRRQSVSTRVSSDPPEGPSRGSASVGRAASVARCPTRGARARSWPAPRPRARGRRAAGALTGLTAAGRPDTPAPTSPPRGSDARRPARAPSRPRPSSQQAREHHQVHAAHSRCGRKHARWLLGAARPREQKRHLCQLRSRPGAAAAVSASACAPRERIADPFARRGGWRLGPNRPAPRGPRRDGGRPRAAITSPSPEPNIHAQPAPRFRAAPRPSLAAPGRRAPRRRFPGVNPPP